jgi:hypothetical protein
MDATMKSMLEARGLGMAAGAVVCLVILAIRIARDPFARAGLLGIFGHIPKISEFAHEARLGLKTVLGIGRRGR